MTALEAGLRVCEAGFRDPKQGFVGLGSRACLATLQISLAGQAAARVVLAFMALPAAAVGIAYVLDSLGRTTGIR